MGHKIRLNAGLGVVPIVLSICCIYSSHLKRNAFYFQLQIVSCFVFIFYLVRLPAWLVNMLLHDINKLDKKFEQKQQQQKHDLV